MDGWSVEEKRFQLSTDTRIIGMIGAYLGVLHIRHVSRRHHSNNQLINPHSSEYC